jgi:hypothetical protein
MVQTLSFDSGATWSVATVYRPPGDTETVPAW